MCGTKGYDAKGLEGAGSAATVHWARWLLPSPLCDPNEVLRRSPWPLLIAAAYLGLISWLGSVRLDHLLLASLALLDLYNCRSRSFVRSFLPFVLTGVLFDLMRYFYWPLIEHRVHVSEPYLRDKLWFGIPSVVDGRSTVLTANEYLDRHRAWWFDIAAGFAYLTFIGEYLLLAFYLFLSGKGRALLIFGWSFLIVNLMGWITYFVYPAAPPWYVSIYGFAPARLDVRPDPAGTARFDELLGVRAFEEMYARGVAVYGAYPSLHVAYPLLVVWMTFALEELSWARGPAIGFFALMCFSAVYLQHHYLVDILLGVTFAVVTAWGASWAMDKGGEKSG